MNQSFFSLGFFSQNSLSGSSLSFMGKRGIYIRVRMECEESGFFFSKQGWLMAWPCGVTESQVPATR